jgi:ribosome-associated protein
METYTLENDYIELCQLLKIKGPCLSGGEAKHEIGSGQVSVNGAIELRKKCKIRKGQEVQYKSFKISVV